MSEVIASKQWPYLCYFEFFYKYDNLPDCVMIFRTVLFIDVHLFPNLPPV